MDGDEALVLARAYIKRNLKSSETDWGDIEGEISAQSDLSNALRNKQSLFQVTTLPDNAKPGVILQYVGLTTGKYTTGYFYRCVGVDENDNSIWEPANLQPDRYTEFIGTIEEYNRTRREITDGTKCWIIKDTKVVYVILKFSTGDILLDINTLMSILGADNKYITKNTEALDNYYKKTETYTQQQVNDLVGQMNNIKYKVVTELPIGEDISKSTIYLIKVNDEGSSYTQWMNIDGEWSSLGNTDINLTNYVSSETFDNFKKTVELDLEAHKTEITKLSNLLDKINNKVVE